MPARRLFLIAYLASGAAGLLYEVAWARLLTLHLGHSTAAVSTVLAAFMGGLAVGAVAAGRFAPGLPPTRSLRAYAVVELLVAGCALVVPAALTAAQPLLQWTYDPVQAGGAPFVVVRILTSLVIVAVPAALMGATFPLAVRWHVRHPDRAGREAGALYAINTVGAAAGAALTAFAFLPGLGLQRTTLVGVILNITAAAIAWRLAGPKIIDATAVAAQPAPAANARTRGRRAAASDAPAPHTNPWLATAALTLSGFVALTYEVTWTRLLALIVGPTTYAFGLMLAVFIGGLAAGAIIGARWSTRTSPLGSVGLTLLLTSVGGLLVCALASEFPLRVARLVAQPGSSFLGIIATEAAGLVALLLPTTLALGAAFPLAVAAATGRDRPVARDAALVYAGNTIGAIAGSLASGFVLVPWLGLRTTMIAVSVAAATGGLAIIAAARPRAGVWIAAAGLAILTFAGAALLPPWNRSLLASGAYKYAPYLSGGDLETILEAGTLLYYAEGATGTVTVRRTAGSVSLAIDGKVDASNTGDMLTQKLLAHLPLLFHPSPKTVAIVGLGSGVTLGSALVHPLERADVMEISREVVEASALFETENRRALADPRTRLLVADARTHLALARDRYDVIISEPSNPWMAGVASLFTREFFETLRARLAPGGLVCQWAHTYDIAGADLRSIVRTFLSVFPQGMLWLIGEGDVLLIAGRDTPDALLARLGRSWSRPGVADDLATVGVRSPFALLSQFVAAAGDLERFAAGAPVQTDDRMALEFTAPRGMVGRSREDNATRLRALAAEVPVRATVGEALDRASAMDWKQRGQMMLQAEAPRMAYDDLSRAATLEPGDLETLRAIERAAADSGRLTEALALFSRLMETTEGRVAARIAASRVLVSEGRVEEGLETIEDALAVAPNDARALAQQASILADAGDVARLEPVARRLAEVAPEDPESRYFVASLAFLTGRAAEAVAQADELLKRAPGHAKALNLLGAAQANLGNLDAAARAFQASAHVDPRDPTAYVNLGLLALERADAATAVRQFAEALTLDPESASAREGLARAQELRGDHRRARSTRDLLPR